jgi:fumarylacetoacetase
MIRMEAARQEAERQEEARVQADPLLATAVGRQFRPDNPLLPNYKWVPIGYHGRASSIVASGTPIRRPIGQTKPADAEAPRLGATQRLDYELELGAFISRANALGDAVPIAAAEDHVFGLTVFNDWTARDIQAWEYQPLGPFLSKNFGSTLSPWVVTMEALAPFRAPLARPGVELLPAGRLMSLGASSPKKSSMLAARRTSSSWIFRVHRS